jgi:hypothetical protein
MATKRSSGPVKKTPRSKNKKAAVEPVVETATVETAIEPVAIAAEPVAARDAQVATTEVPVDEIRRRAYNYWVQGNPDPIANWFRAENELKQH